MRAKREAPPLPDAADDLIDLQAVFESLDFHSTAPAFRGGTLTTWFGGGNLDLRDATLDPMGARLEVRAIFGGGSILVPDEWDVSVRVKGIGGAGDARPARDRGPEAPRLEIEGFALFGGFGVMSQTAHAGQRGRAGRAGGRRLTVNAQVNTSPRRFAALALVAVAIAACGGGSSSPSASLPPHDVLVETDTGGALRFEPSTPTATGTSFQLLFRNISTMPHNLTFQSVDAKTQAIVNPGAFELVPVTVPGPGQYPFACTIHPGMTGTLTVS